jgi:hypothetical protein
MKKNVYNSHENLNNDNNLNANKRNLNKLTKNNEDDNRGIINDML